jgi:hypothetical protein
MELERTDLVKSKELAAMPLADVVAHYGLEQIFHCRELRLITITCIDSDIVAKFCESSNPLNVIWQMGEYLENGFRVFYGGRVVDVKVDVVGANEGQPEEPVSQ